MNKQITEFELAAFRREVVLSQDTEIEIGGLVCPQGRQSVVYEAKHGLRDRILKISTEVRGIAYEADRFEKLKGIDSVPLLIRRYVRDQVTIAILTEKMVGEPFYPKIIQNPSLAVSFFENLLIMVDHLHSIMVGLPMDFRREGNILIGDNGECYMVDLGLACAINPRDKELDLYYIELLVWDFILSVHDKNVIDEVKKRSTGSRLRRYGK